MPGTLLRFTLCRYNTSYTERIIYNQLPTDRRHNINIDVMKIPQQLGTADCGLFAIAIATVLASGLDPTEIVFHQGDMRQHLADCFDKKKMTTFPVKSRKPRVCNKILKRITIFLCPVCGKPDDGNKMIECDSCKNWYHQACVPKYDPAEDDWKCPSC